MLPPGPNHHRAAGFLLAALGFLTPLPARAQQANAFYDSVFTQLRSLAPMAGRVAPVRNLTVRRDAAILRLDSGTMTLLTPVGGTTVGAIFSGRGSLSFVPPLAIERLQLQRVLAESVLAGPIRNVVFIWADSTLAELQRSLTFAEGVPAAESGDRIEAALGFLVDGRSRHVDLGLMEALLNGRPNGFFSAAVRRERGEDVMIQIDPSLDEPILLMRRGRAEGQRVEIVSQFAPGGAPRESSAPRPALEPVTADEYRVAIRLGRNYEFSATADVRVVAHAGGTRWARFSLYAELEIDSLLSPSGQRLNWYRTSRSSDLWVRLERPLAAGDTAWFHAGYHGRLIEWGSAIRQVAPALLRRMPRADEWSFMLSDAWYPRRGSAADFDITFRVPSEFKVVAVGQPAESRVEGNTRISRWVTERPTRLMSFNVGVLRELTITDPRIPPVTMLVNEAAHLQIRAALPHSRNPAEYVGTDIVNSLSFFSTRYGPPLFSRYTASEIPYSHGVAYPGLMHLSWFTFLGLGENGSDESFRAHEMAHQWWGVGVEPASYRDWWLAEGFAEFSGMWYMELILLSNANYLRQLRRSRDAIHRVRTTAAPLGLGTRAAENESGNYGLIVYQKGAWVLHMLRHMALDLNTMSDERFSAMMRDFYSSYRGRRASTREFQRVAERHFDTPMDWFFRQWVERTDIPTYVLSWRTEAVGEQHRLRIRVRQEDVPPDFYMPVPLRVDLGGGNEAVLRLDVRGPLTETAIMLPAAPREVELNPLEAVLAMVRTERWRESSAN